MKPYYEHGGITIYHGDCLDVYQRWLSPTAIVSDGAYGVGGFPGDPRTIDGLNAWYEPHVAAWSRYVLPSTTLWFWNTEVGWATVHPLLVENGWEYVQAITWDKGTSHVAGNVNGDTIRQFPVVTEICALYRRRPVFQSDGSLLSGQDWLRHEWKRSGLPFNKANVACQVKNAATRKYLSSDHLWYWPPEIMLGRLADYANTHGDQSGRPYFDIGKPSSHSYSKWHCLRGKWSHQHGITNVWTRQHLSSSERVRSIRGKTYAHANQKPLEFMRRIITASTELGDVVWEPFGGLCSAVVASAELGRLAFAAEPITEFFELAAKRLSQEALPF